MALTLGVANGLFSEIGSFDAGDFEHTFEERDVIPTSGAEQAEEANAWKGVGVSKVGRLRKVGWSDAEIEQEEKDAKAEMEANVQLQPAGTGGPGDDQNQGGENE
jgi:hypothetical protein